MTIGEESDASSNGGKELHSVPSNDERSPLLSDITEREAESYPEVGRG